MKNKLTMLLMGAMLTFSAFASGSTAIIKGLVTDEKGKAVNAATVTLYNVKDSALVKTDITNADGLFEFASLAAGKYFVKVSAVGNKDYTSEAAEAVDGKDLTLPVTTVFENASDGRTALHPAGR